MVTLQLEFPQNPQDITVDLGADSLTSWEKFTAHSLLSKTSGQNGICIN